MSKAATERSRKWRWGVCGGGVLAAMGLSLALAGHPGPVIEIESQERWSDVVDVFTASRYVVYDHSDLTHHYFRETGKFGPLGPSARFRIARTLFPMQPVAPGSVITYEQNEGQFVVRDRHGGRSFIKASFRERYTREQELYLKAVDAAVNIPPGPASAQKSEAWLEVLRRAHQAGHLEVAERYAQELLAMERSADLRDPGSNRVHRTHLYLGQLALQRSDEAEARAHLLAAATEARLTPTLMRFGPGMDLAQALWAAGDRDTVIEYFRLCRRFWDDPKLTQWLDRAERGEAPDFGANLYYGK